MDYLVETELSPSDDDTSSEPQLTLVEEAALHEVPLEIDAPPHLPSSEGPDGLSLGRGR